MKTENPRKIDKYIETIEAENYAKRAEKKLENIYYKRANDEASCFRYLAKYPEGKYVEKTKEKLEELAYERAKESVFAVSDYIQTYPNGKYRDDNIIIKAEDEVKKLTEAIDSTKINEILATVAATPAEPVKKNEYALIETRFGVMKMKFFPEKAPNHCANFKRLATTGYYDGVKFHRVIPGFMIQGGDINSRDGKRSTDGMGGPGYTIDAEFNDVSHVTGIVSMARTPDPNSAGSQFFICDGSPTFLDNQYTVFGEIIEGKSIIAEIANVPKDGNDNPLEPIFMRVTIVKE
ncbi:MAG: peptidylprolyl isomerase [Candidatus Marinimicrobia bacterium]|nr:peptidylprolyl isomerase [Candidatus Neomarinimicrobiota bacterium]